MPRAVCTALHTEATGESAPWYSILQKEVNTVVLVSNYNHIIDLFVIFLFLNFVLP